MQLFLSYDGEKEVDIGESRWAHYGSRMGNYVGQPLALGDLYHYHDDVASKVEIMKLDGLLPLWLPGPNYPFAPL